MLIMLLKNICFVVEIFWMKVNTYALVKFKEIQNHDEQTRDP